MIHPKYLRAEQPERMPNAIALLRVSTDAQDLARQRADIERVRHKHNINIIRTLELHGISGTAVLDNDQVQQLFRDLEDPAVEGLACSALDRVFRPKDFTQVQILDRFAKRQKLIWTAREGELAPHSDAGFEQCMQLATRAGAEWRELRRRSMDGKRENAATGGRNSGSAPYGYRHDFRDVRVGKRATLLIYEPEAKIVVQIFAWAATGIGVTAIAKKLNLAGVKTQRAGQINPRTKELNSGRWDQAVIYQMLTNRTYSGIAEYPKGSPDAVLVPTPPIIDQPTWGLVQLQLASGKQERSGRPTRKYLLTGLVWCLYCGHRITTFPRRHGGACYRCGHIDRKPPAKRLCDAPSFEKGFLEDAIYEKAWATYSDHDRLVRMIELAYKDTATTNTAITSKTEEAQAELDRLQRLEQRAYQNVQDPDLPRDKAKEDWRTAQRARRDAEFRLAQLQQQAASTPQTMGRQQIEQLARDIAANPPRTFEEKRTFIQLFVKEIRLRSNEAHLQCIIPQHLLDGGDDGGANKKGNETLVAVTPKNSDRCIYSNKCSFTLQQQEFFRPISFSINVKLTKSA